MTKYFYVVQALNERCIERIPDLLTLPSEDPYQVLKEKLIEMYDLSDFQQAKLPMALPLAAGDVHPSELMDRMKALMPLEELDWPSILFMHAFLTCLPNHICAHCVPFAATGSLANFAPGRSVSRSTLSPAPGLLLLLPLVLWQQCPLV